MGTRRVSHEGPISSSTFSACPDNLASSLSSGHIPHKPTCYDHTLTYCQTILLKPSQSLPKIKGCVRWELTAAFILCFLPLYIISTGTRGYLWTSPSTHLISMQDASTRALGWPRFWIRDCTQPGSTIAWCVFPCILAPTGLDLDSIGGKHPVQKHPVGGAKKQTENGFPVMGVSFCVGYHGLRNIIQYDIWLTP